MESTAHRNSESQEDVAKDGNNFNWPTTSRGPAIQRTLSDSQQAYSPHSGRSNRPFNVFVGVQSLRLIFSIDSRQRFHRVSGKRDSPWTDCSQVTGARKRSSRQREFSPIIAMNYLYPRQSFSVVGYTFLLDLPNCLKNSDGNART